MSVEEELEKRKKKERELFRKLHKAERVSELEAFLALDQRPEYYATLREYLQEKKKLEEECGWGELPNYEELDRKYAGRLIEPVHLVDPGYAWGLARSLAKGFNLYQRLERGEISREECNIIDFRNDIEAELRSSKPDYKEINFLRGIIAEELEKVRRGVLTFWNPIKGYYKRKATKKEIEAVLKKGRI